MLSQADGNHPELGAVLEHLLSSGGKRVRPTVVLLTGGMLSADSDRLVTLSAAIELLHTATLVHDDLIDGSLLRRGTPTINANWTPAATVLAGDFIFARAAKLAAETNSLRVMQLFAETLSRIVDGEITQLFSKQRLVGREDYYRRIHSKTASLFELATSAGNGSVLVDLRGMGTNRTVTLINGQRMVDGGDFQTIPSTMIERVEVLKDGASAVYGADAVAGVVNIITRREFEGMEVTAQQADWFDSKGKQYSFGLIGGSEWDSGNVVFGLEYVNQEEAYQRDTPWAFLQDSYYVYPAGCEGHPTLPYTGLPDGGCYAGGSSRIPESSLRFLTQGRYVIGTTASEPYQAEF